MFPFLLLSISIFHSFILEVPYPSLLHLSPKTLLETPSPRKDETKKTKNHRVYNASKAAVIQLGRNLAAEWGPHGIRVNTISPGYIVTDMVRALFDRFPEREAEWPRQNMLGKLSAPEDYRGAAIFLLSDASRFMTGADLRIDGGHTAW